MTDTLTAPRRLNEQVTFAGKRIQASLQESLYILRDSTVDTRDFGPPMRDTHEKRVLSFWRSWFNKPMEKEAELAMTLPTWIQAVVEEEIEGLTFVVQWNEPKVASGINWLVWLSEDKWTFPEILEEIPVAEDIPSPLDQAVNRVISLAKRFPLSRIDEPQVETDPENEGEWWVTLPVWYKGTAEEAFRIYCDLVKTFSTYISPSDREKIRINFQIEE